jgi:phage terminase Nu1 subunit (DNA packaging protein)
MYKSISYSHFARLTGTSEGAVRKAIVRGSISKGVDLSLKKINAYIASNEWGKPILKEFLSDTEIVTEFKKITAPKKSVSVKPIPAPKKQKKEAETIEEFVEEIMHEKLPSADADDLDDETVSEELDDRIQKPEAERVTAVLKAKILQITYKEKQGQLVPIDKVNSVLFGYGQEIRNAFESVPDRIIDRILAVAEKRHEARKILVDEIHSTLELLADINTRDLK